MKRILLTILFASTILTPLFSQKRIDKELWFGVQGGVTFSNMSMSPSISQSMNMGAISGISMRYIDCKYFGLIMEINYSQKGWKEEFKDEDAKYEYSRRIDYIEMPFLCHVYFGNKNFRFFVNLGPEIGINIGEKTTSNFALDQLPKFNLSRETEHYNKEVEKPFDYGLTGGAGIEVRIKNRHSILLEGRYYFGLGDIFNNRSSDYFSVSSNQAILVSLGYQYNIRGRKK